VDEILGQKSGAAAGEGRTGVAVGYVQSGKTTSFTALMAAAADEGYQLIVALLGSTNLLLSQNRARLESAFELSTRRDYKWIHVESPSLATHSPGEIGHYLEKGRVVLITVLKHSGRIDDVTSVLPREVGARVRTLVVDDEADQVSLNTRVNQGEQSSTYAAIRGLRSNLGEHLYVQYTATPYAPLLLAAEDFLSPDFVVLLSPGDGYVGGYEFLVEARDSVVRVVNDAPGPADSPMRLPASLRTALADFVTGAALLLFGSIEAAPVSMLIHPTGRRDPQRRYEFLVQRVLREWRDEIEQGRTDSEVVAARSRQIQYGIADIPDDEFNRTLAWTLNEATTWRINSDEDANSQVQWNLAPVHILIGGNKLSRGFTIEGLTVSWLGRAASPQMDTLVQRARAYGYRRDYLPFCRIYGDDSTVRGLTAAVATDLDMRAQLRDWIDQRLPVRKWATEVGLQMGIGMRPTRTQVVERLTDFHPGWHLLSKPDLDMNVELRNLELVDAIGVRAAPLRAFGRLSHRLVEADAAAVRRLIADWAVEYSPGWDRSGCLAWLLRFGRESQPLPVLYLTGEGGGPRIRAWDERLGFDQLMQGRDPSSEQAYPGDRQLMEGKRQLQIHYVRRRDGGPSIHTLALNVGHTARIVRRGGDDG
jgi:Z1 domain-containing protein